MLLSAFYCGLWAAFWTALQRSTVLNFVWLCFVKGHDGGERKRLYIMLRILYMRTGILNLVLLAPLVSSLSTTLALLSILGSFSTKDSTLPHVLSNNVGDGADIVFGLPVMKLACILHIF
jgi:hypothetical protein